MTAEAGHTVKVLCDLSDPPTEEISGIKQFSATVEREVIDITDFKDTSGARVRIMGLKNVAFTMSGDYDASNQAWADILTNYGDGADIYIRAYITSSNYIDFTAKVQDVNFDAGVDGAVQASVTMVSVDAPTFA